MTPLCDPCLSFGISDDKPIADLEDVFGKPLPTLNSTTTTERILKPHTSYPLHFCVISLTMNHTLHHPAFPFEIFQHIIDLGCVVPVERSPKAFNRIVNGHLLRRCSLVCKAFVPMCRQHLFEHVGIRICKDGVVGGRALRLATTLRNNPSIAQYITRVSYYAITPSCRFVNFESNPRGSCDELKDAQYSASLCELFTEIKALRIAHGSYDEEGVCNEQACLDLCHSIIIPYSQANTRIATLQITGAPLGIGYALLLPNLKQLLVDDASWEPIFPLPSDLDDFERPRPPATLSLKRLELSSTAFFPVTIVQYLPSLEVFTLSTHPDIELECITRLRLDDMFPVGTPTVTVYRNLSRIQTTRGWILKYFCGLADQHRHGIHALPALKSLECCLGWHDPAENEALYTALRHAPMLQTLDITFYAIRDDIFPPLNLARCFSLCKATLRNIRITVEGSNGLQDMYIAKYIADGVGAIQGENRIETIQMCFKLALWGTTGATEAKAWLEAAVNPWKRMDEFLARDRTTSFPVLRKVKISADFSVRYVDIRPIPDQFWLDVFPLCHASSKVNMTDCDVIESAVYDSIEFTF